MRPKPHEAANLQEPKGNGERATDCCTQLISQNSIQKGVGIGRKRNGASCLILHPHWSKTKASLQ